MDWLAQIPFAGRLAILAFVGLWLGGQVNRAIYRLAWDKRSIDPWSPPLEEAPPRQWYDRIPVIGWFGLRREAELHGAGFWTRPLLIEIGTALALAGLYAWELNYGLYPVGWFKVPLQLPGEDVLHAQFLAHAILFLLMLPATFIDFDERTIPDEITTPGTLIGLLLLTIVPTALLPDVVEIINGGLETHPLWLTSPTLPAAAAGVGVKPAGGSSWCECLNGVGGLALGLGCWLAWCWAVIDKTWTTRRGWGKAFAFLCASMTRQPKFVWHVVLTLFGCAAIAVVWAGYIDPGLEQLMVLLGDAQPVVPAVAQAGSSYWQGLLSSLVGMAFAGGVIWAFRIVGSMALGMEAVGFGDVTLMAMVGAYIGWQPALIAIFIAPIVGSGFSIANTALTGNSQIYFGPFLCFGTLTTIVGWRWIWEGYAREHFAHALLLGWITVAIAVGALVIMIPLLILLHAIRLRIFPIAEDERE